MSTNMQNTPGNPAISSRRPPAHRSVSLRQLHGGTEKATAFMTQSQSGQLAASKNDSSSSENAVATEADSVRSSDSVSLVNHRNNSSGETSNVEQWFNKSNRNVSAQKASLNDSDSPFNFEDVTHGSAEATSRAAHFRSHLAVQDSSGSSSEEYRSVIDDLTIENKRLKRKLKKYEKVHDAHLDKDKLFEVKVLGLPPHKKKDLEETLRKFAASLQQSPYTRNSGSVGNRTGNSGNSGISGPGLTGSESKPSSSMTSIRMADSGYGSMGTSGKNSASAHAIQDEDASAQERASKNDQNVRNYLQEIPSGLLPQQPPIMSENSKKKLIVRRLEQIFGGVKASDSGFSQQLEQQQEVSNSASKADREARESRGENTSLEGIRQAPIMVMGSKNDKDQDVWPPWPEGDPTGKRDAAQLVGSDENADKNKDKDPIEQRPTRPLDLDLHRAQVPSENFEYIRHLGFLDSTGGRSPVPSTDGDWIYLNLVVNMAQLHTVNVTTEYVKQAVKSFSKKIELSEDGRKVRWKKEGTMLEGGLTPDVLEESDAVKTEPTSAGAKRPRPSYLEVPQKSLVRSPKKHQTSSQPKENKFAYTPLFARRDSSDSHSSSSAPGEGPELLRKRLEGHGLSPNDGFGSAKGVVPVDSKAGDGPMIFYNNAPFCTDLSGDQFLRPAAASKYQSPTSTPLGSTWKHQPSYVKTSDDDSNGSVFDVSDMSTSLDLSTSNARDEADLKIPSVESSPRQVKFLEPSKPVMFEASGIGGVTPQDNLTITIVRQVHQDGASGNASRQTTAQNERATKLSNVLPRRKRQATPYSVLEKILSTKRQTIEPSPLPPASMYLGLEEESDSDGESDSGSMEFGNSYDKDDIPELNAAVTGPASSTASDKCQDGYDDSYDEEDDEEDDDQSLDFLATARKADPAAVESREREYDAEVAERLAEDIPAGSSAATAGGGSGFSSPELVRHARRRLHHSTIKQDDHDDEENDDDDVNMVSDVSS